MGSSRHREHSSRDRDRRERSNRDRSRDHDRERDRDRDRHRRGSRDRHRDRGDRRERSERSERNERNTERNEREREKRSRSRGEEPTKEKSPEPDGNKLLAETLATIAATRNYAALVAQRNGENTNDSDIGEDERRRRRRSRWAGGEHEKIFIPGMPTILPCNLSKEQEQAYLLQLQIEEVSRKLRSGDLGIPHNPEDRSPSPEPIYSSDGKRLNTREFRTRRRLEEERHNLVLRMQSINPEFKPPVDYNRPPVIRVSDKVMIPQEEHPEINFVGLLIGPRGNTLKTMEKETGAKIIIRGKGSVKEGKVGRKDGQPLPGEDEPLHAYITATNPENVKKAVEKIKEVIRQGVEVPESQNDLRRMQLRELAQLNGTLRENDGLRCNNCGAIDHKSWLCPDKPNVTNNIVCSSCGAAGHIARDCRQKRPGLGGPPAQTGEKAKIDEEYMSLMAELGEGPPPPGTGNPNNNANGPAQRKSLVVPGINMFEPQMAPRPLMPPPPMPQPGMMPPNMAAAAGMPPMPPHWMQGMNWQPGPPGIKPPPPPGATSPPPMAMHWGQPPPPGAVPANGAAMPAWQPQHFGWPGAAATGAPPPPPGIDMSTLLAAPPPPPPPS